MRTDEDVKKLDSPPMRCGPSCGVAETLSGRRNGPRGKKRPRGTYCASPIRRPRLSTRSSRRRFPSVSTSMEAYGILGVASSNKAKWLMIREPCNAGIAKR